MNGANPTTQTTSGEVRAKEKAESLKCLNLSGDELPNVANTHIEHNADLNEEQQELEVYKKAIKFNSINLISGENIAGTIESYVQEHYGTAGMNRLAIAKFLLKSLNFRASNDVLLMLSCTNKARTIIATAGAGKTTSLQLDILVHKMLAKAEGSTKYDPIRPSNKSEESEEFDALDALTGSSVELPVILYLNYNKHNVAPITERHTRMCSQVNALLKKNSRVNDSIDSSTVHAFCYRWLSAFSEEYVTAELQIMPQASKQKIWDAIMKARWDKLYPDIPYSLDYTVMDSLYNYKTESMSSWETFETSTKLIDSELNFSYVKSCITKYDGMKKKMGLMDFTDYLIMMIDLLKTRPDLKLELQNRYKLIIADENQDFTALMNELLIHLYNPEVNELVVVGDPDQTIYAFKGVSPENVVYLQERLEDSAILGLDTNYRCPNTIVDAAKKILSMNILRFNKPIKTVRTGGKICVHPEPNDNQQIAEIVAHLRNMPASELTNTVLTYRNNMSSLIIGEELYYAGIPFKVLEDRRPFNNRVFRQLNEAIVALEAKDNPELNKTLFRFLPVKREVWEEILSINSSYRKNHIGDIVLPDSAPRGTQEALNVLQAIAEKVDAMPVSDYIDSLIRLYRTYYFDFISRSMTPGEDKDHYNLYLQRAYKFFNRPMTHAYLEQELLEHNLDNARGVTMSTFHGLKGLEFKHVIAMDFCNNVFPSFDSIEQKYPINTAIEAKESENRLCYVLVTRAIEDLHLYYLELDPSIYVDILCGDATLTNTSQSSPAKEMSLGEVVGAYNGVTTRLDFIQRLTQGR